MRKQKGFMVSTMILAFFFVSIVQSKVTKTKRSFTLAQKKRIGALAAAPLLLVLVAAVTPDHAQSVQNRIAEAARLKKCKFKEISSDKLADELMNHAFEINLIDVRSKEAFAKGHLPLAMNIPLDDIFNRAWEDVFRQRHKRNVFYADNVNVAKKACLSSKFIGTSENYVLSEPMAEFQARILNPKDPGPSASKQALETYIFRTHARKAIEELDRSLSRLSQPVKKKTVKAKGGCS